MVTTAIDPKTSPGLQVAFSHGSILRHWAGPILKIPPGIASAPHWKLTLLLAVQPREASWELPCPPLLSQRESLPRPPLFLAMFCPSDMQARVPRCPASSSPIQFHQPPERVPPISHHDCRWCEARHATASHSDGCWRQYMNSPPQGYPTAPQHTDNTRTVSDSK